MVASPTLAKSGASKKRYNSAVKKALQALENQRLLCQYFQLERDLLAAREQVLVDSILQLELHAQFREAVEQHEQEQEQQQEQQQQQGDRQQLYAQQHLTDSAGSSYSARLLRNMQPAVAQEILSWGVKEWHNYFTTAASQISIMLHMLARNADGQAMQQPQQPQQQQQPHGATEAGLAGLGNQRIVQVVDKLAASGLVGAIFGDRVGQQLGTVTATNHLSMQQEAPPPEHWRRVLLQLQPTYVQLCQLAAGYQEFARLRRAHQAMQLALTDHVECQISCNPQTLVVASGQDGGGAAGSSGEAGSACAAAAATAAEEPSVPACSSLMDQLLRSLNHAFTMVQALMLNTFTNRQIAVLVVSSFPFVPRPAPLMEAAYELLTTQQAGTTAEEQEAAAAAAAAPAGTDSDSAAAAPKAGAAEPAGSGPGAAVAALHSVDREQVDIHMRQRVQQLQQHVQRWWRFELH